MKLLCVLLVALTAFAQKPRRETSNYTVGPSIQPMVIYGEGWSQQFTIINVAYYDGGEPTIGALRFFTRTGQPWALPIRGVGAVEQVPVNLRSGQMMIVETEVSQQSQQLGWALLDLPSNSAWGIYHAFATYRKQTSGAPDLMTSVPFFDDLEDEAIIPFANRDGKYPGIGIVNNGTSSETYRLDVHDVSGALRKTITKSVPARNLHWFSLVAENPELAGVAGQIKVSSGFLRMSVFMLQFAANGAFTALPLVHTFGMRCVDPLTETVILNPEKTRSFWETQTLKTVSDHPGAISNAQLRSTRNSTDRRQQTALSIAPGVVTG